MCIAVLSTALTMMNLVTGCRRYNCRRHGANCRDRRCRKRSSGNSTFGSHWRCRCSGRERDSWCSLRLRGQVVGTEVDSVNRNY